MFRNCQIGLTGRVVTWVAGQSSSAQTACQWLAMVSSAMRRDGRRRRRRRWRHRCHRRPRRHRSLPIARWSEEASPRTPPEGDGGATRVVGIVTQVGMGRGRKAAGSKQPVVLSAAAIEVRLQLPNPVTAYPLVTVSLHRRRCSRSVACPRHQGRMAIGGRGRGIHRRRSSRKPVACCDAQSLPRSRRSLPRLIKSFGMEWSRPRPHVVNGTCAD